VKSLGGPAQERREKSMTGWRRRYVRKTHHFPVERWLTLSQRKKRVLAGGLAENGVRSSKMKAVRNIK